MPKDNQPSKEKYTFKCEIFSFGMLLWELCAQMLPYKSITEMKDIITHVMDKQRETFEAFNNLDSKNKSIPKGFTRIIKSGKYM